MRQWRILFNVEKKEAIFILSGSNPSTSHLNLGNEVMARRTEHKHLGMILAENVDLKSHN